MRAYTHGGLRTCASQHIFWLGKKSQFLSCAPGGVRTRGQWCHRISSPTLYHHEIMCTLWMNFRDKDIYLHTFKFKIVFLSVARKTNIAKTPSQLSLRFNPFSGCHWMCVAGKGHSLLRTCLEERFSEPETVILKIKLLHMWIMHEKSKFKQNAKSSSPHSAICESRFLTMLWYFRSNLILGSPIEWWNPFSDLMLENGSK